MENYVDNMFLTQADPCEVGDNNELKLKKALASINFNLF